MMTVMVKGNIKDVFRFEDDLTTFIQNHKNNGVSVELVISDKKSSWYSQLGRAAAKGAKWWMENV
jgi:hypothetical protein